MSRLTYLGTRLTTDGLRRKNNLPSLSFEPNWAPQLFIQNTSVKQQNLSVCCSNLSIVIDQKSAIIQKLVLVSQIDLLIKNLSTRQSIKFDNKADALLVIQPSQTNHRLLLTVSSPSSVIKNVSAILNQVHFGFHQSRVDINNELVFRQSVHFMESAFLVVRQVPTMAQFISIKINTSTCFQLGQCHLYHSDCRLLINACELKEFFNLATEVPASFLNRHIVAACLQLQSDCQINSGQKPPTEFYNEWRLAQYYLALAYVLPHLNMFTLQGAARAERLATQMDARFMDSREVQEQVTALKERYKQIVKRIKGPSQSAFIWINL